MKSSPDPPALSLSSGHDGRPEMTLTGQSALLPAEAQGPLCGRPSANTLTVRCRTVTEEERCFRLVHAIRSTERRLPHHGVAEQGEEAP